MAIKKQMTIEERYKLRDEQFDLPPALAGQSQDVRKASKSKPSLKKKPTTYRI